MIVCVEGSKTFDDYNIFMRAMGVALSELKDKEVLVWSAGPHKINNYTAAFCNSSENFLRARGIKIKFFKVSSDFVKKRAREVDYFAYLCQPHEGLSSLTAYLDIANIEVGVFRY